jgi:hypothetical protein
MTTARITGIGSLPHHNVDAALEYSLRMSIPFLPQIPIRNPWEYMIPQALEGLPGLEVDRDGSFVLDEDLWKKRAPEFGRKLDAAFASNPRDLAGFEAFEPGATTSSCWQPFLWELSERKIAEAKIQIAGPLTSQWVLRFKSGSDVASDTAVSSRIFQLVLARSIAMVRRLKSSGIQPILYLDEPGLYGLLARDPKHLLALQELKLVVQTLRKEGATVGLHCCSNTDWKAVLELGLDVLSIDAALSLENVATHAGDALETFLHSGGMLSLGIIPTGRASLVHAASPEELFHRTLETFGRWPHARSNPALIHKALSEAICTPACGLALQSVGEAEWIASSLEQFAGFRDKMIV